MAIQMRRGLRRRSAAAHLLRLWVRIPPGAWMSVCCECCVLSGRDLCNELTPRPEESYRLWYVVVCDLETSWMRRPWHTGGLSRQKKKNRHYNFSANGPPGSPSTKAVIFVVHSGQICTPMPGIRFPCRPDQFWDTPSVLATKWSYIRGKRAEMLIWRHTTMTTPRHLVDRGE
jgi:hypothetical protein